MEEVLQYWLDSNLLELFTCFVGAGLWVSLAGSCVEFNLAVWFFENKNFSSVRRRYIYCMIAGQRAELSLSSQAFTDRTDLLEVLICKDKHKRSFVTKVPCYTLHTHSGKTPQAPKKLVIAYQCIQVHRGPKKQSLIPSNTEWSRSSHFFSCSHCHTHNAVWSSVDMCQQPRQQIQ